MRPGPLPFPKRKRTREKPRRTTGRASTLAVYRPAAELGADRRFFPEFRKRTRPFFGGCMPLLYLGPNGRKWGRNPKQLTPADLEAEGIKSAPPLAVMRAMCLTCREPNEIVVCARTDCPLWPYRLGTNPWRRGGGENLKKARAAKVARNPK
jgi:hypothetical protein